MRTTYLFSLLFFCFGVQATTINPIIVEAKYAYDVNSTWHIADLNTKPFLPFSNDNTINLGYNKNANVWCVFKIKNPDKLLAKKTWLCFENNHIDSLIFYDYGIQKILGDRTKNPCRFIESQAYEISLKPNEERTCLFRLKKGISFFQFSFRLDNEQRLARKSNVKIAEVSFILGTVFLLIVLNFVLFIIYKERLYMFYVFYAFLSAFYIMISSNYAKNFLWPDFIYFSECRIYVSSLWFISLSFFASHYLQLTIYQPRVNKAIFIMNMVNLAIILSSLVCLIIDKISLMKLFFSFGYVNFLCTILLIIWSTLQRNHIERKKAIYILMAVIPQFAWMSAIILRSFQIIQKSLPENWLIFINLYEVFLFGFILIKNYVDTFTNNKKLLFAIHSEKEKSLQAITQAQIRERRSISNIIHDNLGSKIAHINHLLQLNNTVSATENIQILSEDIRDLSHRILPKSLDEGALLDSLQSQITILNSSLNKAKIELYHYDFPEKLNKAWIYDVYLISLEIMNNSLHHGNATSVIIELYGYKNKFIFQYTDNGTGFDTKITPKGFGLENIEKRVRYYKGIFSINSGFNKGTIVQITLPKKKKL